MKYEKAVMLALLSSMALWLAGCEALQSRGLLWPQGPGNAPDGVVQRREPPPRNAPSSVEAASSRTTPPAKPAPKQVELSQAPTDPAASSAALTGYTQASRYGDLLFISGQIPLDLRTNKIYEAASVGEQTRVVMDNIKFILESHRLTMANIVSTTVYLRNINDFREMDTVYDSYFRATPPARTVVEVNKLPRGVALQISVIAGK
jgi:2-iminobutanoate/2-iminopropanoate deaminase